MTIITPGTIPSPAPPWWVNTIVTCNNCGCVFRLDDCDTDISSGINNGGRHRWLTVQCPHCRVFTSKSDIPL